MPERADGWVWDRYWHYDRIASCFDEGRANYSEPVAAPWKAFFAECQDGAAILDLCTGNGALALIAAETAAEDGRRFAITGIDKAAIDPAAYVSRHADALRTIDFRGSVAAESLPFGDESFDAVVSQYGAEYAPRGETLAEAVRVLRPGGRIALVMHAADGTVAARAKTAMDDADFLLDDARLPAAALACFRAVAKAEQGETLVEAEERRARSALTAFETALKRTGERLETASDPEMLKNSARVLIDAHTKRQLAPLSALEEKAEEVRLEIAAHRGRLQALLDVAVSAEDCADMARDLSALGCEDASWETAMNGDALIGYRLKARRAA